jgi:4-hydroxybenzoate polyprenyltransferase/phosphoserine phosphatase
MEPAALVLPEARIKAEQHIQSPADDETRADLGDDHTPLLCVDLDGTLVRSDLLWESLFGVIARKPLSLIGIPSWLLRGRASLKRQLADRATIDVSTLPYNQDVLRLIRETKDRGGKVVLATASEERLATAIAKYLGVFDLVIGSDGKSNIKSEAKLAAIREHLRGRDFVYVGDSRADLPVWGGASKAYVVSRNASLKRKIESSGVAFELLETPRRGWRDLGRLLRPHQWAKNLLLLVPVITGHRIWDLQNWAVVLLGIVAFSAVASAVYIFNDLIDLAVDRRHPTKRKRPLASGEVAIPLAVAIGLGLIAVAFLLSLLLPWKFVVLLLVYFFLTSAYSVSLKRLVLVDVICLAGLYALRIEAGGAATNIVISPWLLSFSMFFFLSLAFVKRYTELRSHEDRASSSKIGGRGYMPLDLDLIRSMGPGSGYLSVLVFSLYINSPDVVKLYRHPQILWLICPILLYWISRVWMFAGRGCMNEDPVYFALKDRIGLVSAALIAFVLLLAH